ncbi:MAG: regulatory protein RecX [Candidatus Omnitrophota bacterium]
MKDYTKALNYAFLLLKYRPRSQEEIKRRLKRKGYSPSLIENVLQYLLAHQYLDDGAFAHMFVASCLAKGWGARRIDFALKQLGVAESIRKEAQPGKDEVRKSLREIIQKRSSRPRNSKNAYQKLVRHLLTRGFNYADIVSELENIGVDTLESK